MVKCLKMKGCFNLIWRKYKMNLEIEEVVYHRGQMILDFDWQEFDNELIKREATISVANGEYDDWDHAYESHWDMWEAGDLVLTGSY